jgi:hypothetical protein
VLKYEVGWEEIGIPIERLIQSFGLNTIDGCQVGIKNPPLDKLA